MANQEQIAAFGTSLGELFYTRTIDPRTLESLASLSLDEAYAAQNIAVNHRLARGEQRVGYKVGCTSQSIRQQLGLTEPYFAHMTSPHVRTASDTPIDWRQFVSLALEPELVIRLVGTST